MHRTAQSIFTILIILFLHACNGPENNTLPYSVGGVDEMVVVLEKVDSSSALFQVVNNYLGATFKNTPQPERRFNVLYTDLPGLNKTFIRHRNIIMIGSFEKETAFTQFISDLVGEQNKGKVLGSEASYFLNRENVWSKPQYIEIIVAATDSLLLTGMDNTLLTFIDRISERELNKIRNNQYLPGDNKEVEAFLRDKHKIGMRIPSDFKMLQSSNDNFIFLRKSTIDQSTAIMIWYEPFRDTAQLQPAYLIRKRDSLGGLYESSNVQDSYMQSEHRLSFQHDTISFKGMYCLESRGLWRLVNDFMGGPFINYWIYDEKNNRMIYLDGYTYAPDLKKRPLIRELQAILTTFESL
ncbi:MAG: DUF4837 family protein [Chitinophagales bacterium]